MCGINVISRLPFCILYRHESYDRWVSPRYLSELGSDGSTDDWACAVRVSGEVMEQMINGEAKIDHTTTAENGRIRFVYWLKEGDGAYIPFDEGFAVNA